MCCFNKQVTFYTLLYAFLFLFSSCKVQIVTPYDQVIDNGLSEYKEELNIFVKNMADSGGTEEGTFELNKQTYNELETQIELLIDRAKIQSTGSCKLSTELTSKVVDIMNDNIPIELTNVKTHKDGNSFGCTEKLLVLIKKQLDFLKEIHSTTDKCKNEQNENISCVRPATAKSVLDISNQSINAAWVVETAKKSSKDKID